MSIKTSKIERKWTKLEEQSNRTCDCKVGNGLRVCTRRAKFRHGFMRYCQQHAEASATPAVIAGL